MPRIGLTGTNWTGKTATIQRLIKDFPDMPIEAVSLASFVVRCPYPTGEIQTLEASQWITKQVRSICDRPHETIQLFDRTPIDVLAFTMYVENQTGHKSQALVDDLIDLTRSFDFLLYLSPSDQWPVGIQPTPEKIQFARLMDSYIRKAIEKFSLNITEFPWDMAKRNNMLIEYLGLQAA